MLVLPACSGKISNPIFRLHFFLRMTHRFSLHSSPTCPARISVPELSPQCHSLGPLHSLSSHNCWAPQDYFPFPNRFQIRAKALNSLLHKGTATLPIKQMLQEHKCHEIPQLPLPRAEEEIHSQGSQASTEGNPASPSSADGPKLISAPARSHQDCQG